MQRKLFMTMLAFLAFVGNASADKLSIADVTVEQGGQATVVLNYEFAEPYYGWQIDMQLPDGITVGRRTLSDALDEAGFSVSYSKLASGKSRFLGYTLDASQIPTGNDELFHFVVKADANMELGTYEVTVPYVEFTNSAGQATILESVTFNLTVVEKPLDIDEVHFPDAPFRQWVLDNADEDKDGKLTKDEIRRVKVIDAHDQGIRDITGIEHFIYVEEVYLYNNYIREVDFTYNVRLRKLHVYNNEITKVNVTYNVELVEFYIYNNYITTIDVTKNVKLVRFHIYNNYITQINLRYNVELVDLYIYNNRLTYIDLTYNIKLVRLHIYNNYITQINLRYNVELVDLYIYNNRLTTIDLTYNIKLVRLHIYNNYLTDINLRYNVELVDLYIYNNRLTTIDLTYNIKLVRLHIYNNYITQINLRYNVELVDLYIYNNRLTTIDLTYNVKLVRLYIYNNYLTEINVTYNVLLEDLYIYNNVLTTIDLTKNVKLVRLHIYNNKLTEINLTYNVLLEDLYIYNNKLAIIDLTKNVRLVRVYLYNNELTWIKLAVNVDIIEAVLSTQKLVRKAISVDGGYYKFVVVNGIDLTKVSDLTVNGIAVDVSSTYLTGDGYWVFPFGGIPTSFSYTYDSENGGAGGMDVNISFGDADADGTETINVTTDYGFITYCSENGLDFTDSENLKAYIIASYDGDIVYLSRVTEVPPATGLILKAEAGEYDIPFAVTDDSYVVNMLVGVNEPTVIEPTEGIYTNFILADGNRGLGFYRVKEEGTIAAHRAYLQLPTAKIENGAKYFRLMFDDGTTSIQGIETQDENGAYYDLQGRRYENKPVMRGIYIHQGKKMVVK
ncbi:MAG: hypothetical protein IJK42_01370 [Prevotella sp.]|nr:hypothetical protein [Prevotella sp.]